jgi:outer membrane protein insertion porin family
VGIVQAVAARSVCGQDPGARVDAGSTVDRLVQGMEGKPVRSIAIVRADRPGAAPVPVAPELADSCTRSLATRVGQPFEQRKVSADCQNLWSERRLVVHCYAVEQAGEVVLTYSIEHQIPVYADFEWKGLVHFDLFTVNGLLGIQPGRQVTHTEGEAMRKVLLARYRRDGYAFASITLEPGPLEDTAEATAGTGAMRKLVFLVDEGPKVTVGTVAFVGNASFAAAPPFGLFYTSDYLVRDARVESKPAFGLISGSAYSREVLEEDLDRLRVFYRGRGFLDATVDLADVRFTPDRSCVDLTFVVVEGPRYRIRSVKVEHVDGSPDKALARPPLYPAREIEAELKVQAGEFYDHDRLQRDVLAITDFYGRRGHPPVTFPGMVDVPGGCQVFTPRETYGKEPEVDIVFLVSEGVEKRLRDVLIRGNRYTQDHVIRRRFRQKPGERIDMVSVKRSLRHIEQTRYFSDPTSLAQPRLQIEPVPGQPDLVDLGLDVADGPTGQLRWGVGISTGQGVQGQVTFNKSNFDIGKPPSSLNPITAIGEVLDNKAFHGAGQNLGMLLAPGTRTSQFQLSFTEPDVFGLYEDTYELRVSGRRTIRRLTDGATADTLGAEVGLWRNLTENLNVGLSVRQESVEVDNLLPDATSFAYAAEGKTELRGVRLGARLRDYDDPGRPTEGFELGLSGEVVGGPFGGEESLTKLTHSAHLYVPLAENEMGHRTVLHLEQFLGFANAFGGSDDVFLTERFYMGGANLRGFDYRRAGPKQFGRPIGGEAVWTSTVELFMPLVATRLEGEVRDRELLRWLVFTDFGLLGLDAGDPTFGELRASSGIGLRIEIPLLEIPIALDLGWPWMYEDSDDRRQLYFSISR